MGKIQQAESAYEKMTNALKQFRDDGITPFCWDLSQQAHNDLMRAALWDSPTLPIETWPMTGIRTLYGYPALVVYGLGAGMAELVGADGSRVSFQIEPVPEPPPRPHQNASHYKATR